MDIIIYNNKNEHASIFDYLKPFTIFEYDDDFYFKTRNCYDEDYEVIANAVDLHTGAPCLFNADDKVTIHQSTLIIDGVSER